MKLTSLCQPGAIMYASESIEGNFAEITVRGSVIVYWFIHIINNNKVKRPRYKPTWPRVVQEVKAPRFLDTRHMKVVRSSPLRTGRLYPQEYPGTHI